MPIRWEKYGRPPWTPDTCPVHGDPLEIGRVRVIYGLVVGEIVTAIPRHVPWGGVALGGCIVGPGPIREGPVGPACVAAYAAWKSEAD